MLVPVTKDIYDELQLELKLSRFSAQAGHAQAGGGHGSDEARVNASCDLRSNLGLDSCWRLRVQHRLNVNAAGLACTAACKLCDGRSMLAGIAQDLLSPAHVRNIAT